MAASWLSSCRQAGLREAAPAGAGEAPNWAAAGAAHRTRSGHVAAHPRRNLTITVPTMEQGPDPKLAIENGSAGMVTKVWNSPPGMAERADLAVEAGSGPRMGPLASGIA